VWRSDFNELEPALVLVVDDNEDNRLLIAGMFAGSHHKLEFGSDGLEAVNKARALRPNLILLDLRMPGLDGRGAFAEIRKSPGLEVVPIIAVTASTFLQDEGDLREKFNGYLRKPFSASELFAEVSQFLPRRTKTSPARDDRGAPPAMAPVTINPFGTPPELVQELRRLIAEDWPTIRGSLAINETKAFARKLESLAGRWPSQELVDYTQELFRRADNLEVVELEQQLDKLSTLLEQLSRPVAA
jgi:CheY-like chemotaxis protein